ncbi:MAG TPA: ATP-binding protein [Bacteroidales bacterium]|jgi:nitrogen fixation/metabolism regulation signal transduction histidine kinase|nr:ATP-binding protein [Bacteroidales bacterium]
MTTTHVILLILGVIVITAIITSYLTSRRMRKKVTYMLDALEDKEYNFRFGEGGFFSKKFNASLNRLRNMFDQERKEISTQEQYFGLMLDHVKTGVIVIEQNGRVNYSNKTALELLGIATLGNIKQLKTVSESLFEAFESIADTGLEQRASFYNESGKVTISLTSSKATIGKKEVEVVAFNDITSNISESEQESWAKLIRVLTHEIMNTVTPIASLSEALQQFDNVEEQVRSGLGTIAQSSRGLIKFVDTYRTLTRVATPVKKAVLVRDLVERVISLTQEQAQNSGATVSFEEKSEDILLFADEGQIIQILINIVKNALEADATKIQISAEINLAEQIIIEVHNNGTPISKESREELFVPFFTTKQEGTGIGLSLSNQIMRLHNGSINLVKSDSAGTIFKLIFR